MTNSVIDKSLLDIAVLGFEWGYKSHERGMNIIEAKKEFKKILQSSKKKTSGRKK